MLQKSVLQWLTDPNQKHVKFVGLSATPWARGLATYYDSLVIGATIAELVEAGFLRPSGPTHRMQPGGRSAGVLRGSRRRNDLLPRR